MLFAKLNSNIRRLGMYALVAVLAFSAGFATLAHATNPVTFYACQSIGLKSLYNVVTSPSTPLECKRGDVAVQWNQVGPKGDTGTQGEQGIQGLQGPEGPQGSTVDSNFYKRSTSAYYVPYGGMGPRQIYCDPGDSAISYTLTGGDLDPQYTRPIYDSASDSYGWSVFVGNNGPSALTIEVIVVCLKIQ